MAKREKHLAAAVAAADQVQASFYEKIDFVESLMPGRLADIVAQLCDEAEEAAILKDLPTEFVSQAVCFAIITAVTRKHQIDVEDS